MPVRQLGSAPRVSLCGGMRAGLPRSVAMEGGMGCSLFSVSDDLGWKGKGDGRNRRRQEQSDNPDPDADHNPTSSPKRRIPARASQALPAEF